MNSEQIEKMRQTIRQCWPQFEAMGWKSASGAVSYYERAPEKFEDDLVTLDHLRKQQQKEHFAIRTSPPAADWPGVTRQIRDFKEMGFDAYEIQEKLGPVIEGSPVAVESIQRIIVYGPPLGGKRVRHDPESLGGIFQSMGFSRKEGITDG